MKICKEAKCTGCGVCADACPKKSIEIKYDRNGFYKSYIDESMCIKCNRCKTVCPSNHPNKKHHINMVYKARRNDKKLAMESTSGGIASAFSEHIVNNGGVVVGCGYDDQMCLKHTLASKIDELEKFKGSKYVQSYTVGIYRQTRAELQNKKTVLFIGTPCQVSALKNFLGKEYDNLYTVDFVCHGVPSQYALDKYIKSIDMMNKPVLIKFRNKTNGYLNKKMCAEMQVLYQDKIVRNTSDLGIYYWFSSSLSVRDSCYNCSFVSTNRASDITLADYIGNDLTEYDNEIGVSTIFVNSTKGDKLLRFIDDDIVKEPRNVVSTVKKYNRLMSKTYKPRCRQEFFNDLVKSDYETLKTKYVPNKVLPSKMIRRYRAIKYRLRNLFVKKV